jgi:hypothetical protein
LTQFLNQSSVDRDSEKKSRRGLDDQAAAFQITFRQLSLSAEHGVGTQSHYVAICLRGQAQ